MDDPRQEEKTTPPLSASQEQERQCFDHARDLITSAERVLGADNAHANIAYHLAILALEEIGKAGMIGARAVAKSANWSCPGFMDGLSS